MSLPRREARERGPNTESCHQRIVSTSRLPSFFWLLIARAERSRALVSCGLDLGAGDEHTLLPFGLNDRGPGLGPDLGRESLAPDGLVALGTCASHCRSPCFRIDATSFPGIVVRAKPDSSGANLEQKIRLG